MKKLLILATALALITSCKESKDSLREGMTVHRFGDACVVLYKGYQNSAMSTIPCPEENNATER